VTPAIQDVAASFPREEHQGRPRGERERHPQDILANKEAFRVGMAPRSPVHLAIVSDRPATIGTGPAGGEAVDAGLVIAGRVAADSWGAFLLDFETNSASARPNMPPDRHGVDGGLIIQGLPMKEAVRVFRIAAHGEAF
jgi:hypothetical protein